MDAAEAWLELRSTLARAPGKAGKGKRNALYVACILQFEQLVRAATAVAPHARPLPLYYAAMHAAKALAAAFGRNPALAGHGLRQASTPVPIDVMDFEVVPNPKEPSVFSELCTLTASGRVKGEIRLADLFLSLPPLTTKPNSISGNAALRVQRGPDPTEWGPIPDPVMRLFVIEAPSSLVPDVYPTMDGWEEEVGHRPSDSEGRLAHVFRRLVDFRDRLPELHKVAPQYGFSSEHWLIPKIDNTTAILSPLATWYALLFGFSLLARYEPAGWVAALDVRQRHAVAIEGALDEATTALPELVWKHISVVLAEEALAR